MSAINATSPKVGINRGFLAPDKHSIAESGDAQKKFTSPPYKKLPINRQNSCVQNIYKQSEETGFSRLGVLGSALTLGGMAASVSIGALRSIPLMTAAIGVGILSLALQPSNADKKSSPLIPPGKAQSSRQISPWKACAMALATAALAIPIFYYSRTTGCRVSDVFLLTEADPARTMAKEVPSFKDKKFKGTFLREFGWGWEC